jgi:hypothetical protein
MRTMSRTALMLLGSISLFAFGTTGAIAAQALPAGCTKDQGVITCTSSDPVGNSENSGGQSQTKDTNTTSQGNLTNKKNSCTTGPGNQTTCP